MKKYLFLLLFIFLMANSSYCQTITFFETNKAFKTGESLNYTVKYSLYLDIDVAGFILKVEEQELKGKKLYGLTAYGETYNYSDNFLKVKIGYQSIVNKNNFLPVLYIRSLTRNEKESKKTVILNRSRKVAINKETKLELPIKSTSQDIISTLYLIRTFNFKNSNPGDTYWINTFFAGKTWDLGIKYIGKETINTKLGKISCYKLQPVLSDKLIDELNFFSLSDDDKLFKSDEQINIWLTDDENKIPVRIKSITNLGSLIIDINKCSGLKNTPVWE